MNRLFIPSLIASLGLAASVAVGAPAKPTTPKLAPGTQSVLAAQVSTVDGKWRCLRGYTSGMVLGTRPKKKTYVYFIAYGALQRNAVAASRKAKGSKKVKLTTQARKYKVLREQGNAACMRTTSGGGGLGGGPGGSATPLEVSFAGAVGVAAGGAASATARSLRAIETQNAATGLNAVLPDGSLRSAVTRGRLAGEIRGTYIGPDGAVYIIGLNLRPEGAWSTGCTIYRAPRAGGELACLSSSASAFTTSPLSPPVQFDASGAAYFVEYGSDSNAVVRWAAGSKNAIVTVGTVWRWLVAPNGDLFIAGQSPSSSQNWTRRFPAGGGVQQLLNSGSQFLAWFGDGNVYFGGQGMERFLVGTATMDPTGWLGCSYHGGPWAHDASLITGIDGCGESVHNVVRTTSSGRTYAYRSNGRAYRVWPTPATLSTVVTQTTTAVTVGEELLLAGTNAGGQQVTTRIDTNTGNETTLMGGANEIEVYRLRRAPGARAVMFDGLRFADNTYVVGRINLNTNEVTVKSAGASKLSDFETFPG